MTIEQLKALKTGDYVFVQEPLMKECWIKPHVWKKCYLRNYKEKDGEIILSTSGSGFVIKLDDIYPFEKWNYSVYVNQQLGDLKRYSQAVYKVIDKWGDILKKKEAKNDTGKR